MASSLIYRRLVLFDCDDGRLSLFKDHDKYLSRIPSNCECYIFWNDLKLPVYKKLKWILRKYSHIHLCPSYSEQMDDSCTGSSDLLFYLDKLIYKFPSILLVHGDDQSYRKIFERVTKQYGNGKMELEVINKPFSQHLPHILTRIRKKNHPYRHHEHLKNVSSKDLLKHERRAFFSNGLWNFDNNPILYGLEENINFKCIIKRKQKNLKNYFYNVRLYGTTQLSADFHANDQYEQDNACLSTKHDQTQMLVLQTNLQQIFSLPLQSSKNLRLTVAVTRYFDPESDELITHSIIQFSIYFGYQKSMTQEKGSKKMKASIDNKRQTKVTLTNTRTSKLHKSKKMVKQEYVQKAGIANNPKSRPSHCSQCIKKFKCIGDLEQHFYAKHVQPSFDNSTAAIQEKKNIAENAIFDINNSFYWPQLSENVKSITRSDTGPTVEHIKPFMFTYVNSSCHNDTSLMTVQKQIKPNQHTISSTETILSCWQCVKKFKTNRSRVDHFINKHTATILSTTNISSFEIGNRTALAQEELNNAQVANIPRSTLCSCWKCAKKLKSDRGRISHFVHKHASFILSIYNDPSSILQNQIVMVQERLATAQKTAISTAVLYNCSQCSRKFKSADARINHCNSKHAGSSVSTIRNQ